MSDGIIRARAVAPTGNEPSSAKSVPGFDENAVLDPPNPIDEEQLGELPENDRDRAEREVQRLKCATTSPRAA